MSFADVNEVNKRFSEGLSLNKLSEELGRHKATIKAHYLKLGYKYNKTVHQFVEVESDTEPTTPTTVNNDVEVNSSTNTSIDNYDALEKRMKALEKRMDVLSKQSIRSDFTLDSRVLNNDIMTRSIKVSESIMNSFTRLCESKYNMYSKQDLISMALLEFLDKYK